MKDSESVFNFNRRFGNAYQNLVGGQTVKEVDRIRVHLRALRQHPDSRILERGKYDSLSRMQQVLVKEEENAKTQSYQSEPRHKTSKCGAKRVVAQANQAQQGTGQVQRSSNTTSLRPFKGSCHGCKRQGHMLRDCRSTSNEDKCKTHSMMKEVQKTSNSRAMELKKRVKQSCSSRAGLPSTKLP